VRAQDPVTPEDALVLARWFGMGDAAPPEELAAALEQLRKGVERLYAIHVGEFEFAFLQPDARARPDHHAGGAPAAETQGPRRS
jgi:hypothetical protein